MTRPLFKIAMEIAADWPVHDIAEGSTYSVHMIQHLVLSMVATPLLLLGGVAMTVLASALFWWVPALSPVSLPLLGLGLAPIFPALMTLTSSRVPEAGVGAAVGLQTASSGLGSSVAPATVGLLLQRFGLNLLGPGIFGFALALAAVSLLLEAGSTSLFRPWRKPPPPPAPSG